jgi:hypothetical protein
MSEGEFDQLFARADARTKLKLGMLEIWGQTFLEGRNPDSVRELLRAHASVMPA